MDEGEFMTIKYAFKQSIPIMAGYLVLGMGFGVLLQSKGYGIFWAFIMSAFIYAGSMQFVTIDLLSGGATLIASALMTLMVNARMLVVYCLRKVTPLSGNHGLPELIASLFVIGLHLWRKNTLLSVGFGTILYMFFVQVIF